LRHEKPFEYDVSKVSGISCGNTSTSLSVGSKDLSILILSSDLARRNRGMARCRGSSRLLERGSFCHSQSMSPESFVASLKHMFLTWRPGALPWCMTFSSLPRKVLSLGDFTAFASSLVVPLGPSAVLDPGFARTPGNLLKIEWFCDLVVAMPAVSWPRTQLLGPGQAILRFPQFLQEFGSSSVRSSGISFASCKASLARFAR